MVAAHAVATLALLAVSAALVAGPWQQVCTDFARQEMFRERDRLFDIARAGRLSFESPEYRDTRASINSVIRIAHDLNWLKLLVWARLRSASRPLAYETIRSEALRVEVEEIVHRVSAAAIRMIVMKSPLLILVSPILWLLVRNRRRIGDLIRSEAELMQARPWRIAV